MQIPLVPTLLCFLVLAGCASQRSNVDTTAIPPSPGQGDRLQDRFDPRAIERGDPGLETQSIFDVFDSSAQEQTVAVNKYLWAASLEVLNFLPVQTVDPFTGIIVTDYGTPPGSGRAYRATILIDDPALDARSLNVSLQTRNGPASASAVRAVENAILSRARQLRIADNAL